ncbi:MAG TPA: GntR family transcriptional regulator [Thermoanaerobaculia bacterium]|jgi:DNA-binding transcriptional regulator YhcF (GntR family)
MDRRREVIRDGLQQRVMSGLHLGRLHPGERLGSARQTARESGTDYRMVVAALRGLEHDGLLEIRPRGGIYVGCRGPRSRSYKLRGFGDRLAEFILGELAGGLPVAAAAERLRHCLDTARLRAACIECNQDQLDFLCQELQVGFGLESAAVEIDRLRGGPPLPVRQADVLVSTTFHTAEVRRWAARLGKACVIVTLDPRRRDEVTRLLTERPVYFIGTDPRWAAKARVIWAREPGAERLRVLTIGHDALGNIPEDAAVMLMPRARQLLAGTALMERALPHRGLSRETKRQILSFLVHANMAAATARGSG